MRTFFGDKNPGKLSAQKARTDLQTCPGARRPPDSDRAQAARREAGLDVPLAAETMLK
ncbi:hypothetical protein MBRA_57320 (plasmid) [Mycobacterium branderi]|uniref:Uncharacterized protein n=1 Tax=Mycobacterium branderi TaxID=43348 RepID=A0ABM7KWV1_9MYCO|nr:hypothetical protein MBRA_57320 [Mycobacterium branderi]